MPQPDAHTPPLNASWLRAVAAAENTSSTVEFRIRPLAASWRYQMYVIVDKEYVYWWDESMRLQNFRGVTLYQPAGIQNMSHVIAQFDSGAGVEVIANKGHMSVHVYAPYTFVVSSRRVDKLINFNLLKTFFLEQHPRPAGQLLEANLGRLLPARRQLPPGEHRAGGAVPQFHPQLPRPGQGDAQ